MDEGKSKAGVVTEEMCIMDMTSDQVCAWLKVEVGDSISLCELMKFPSGRQLARRNIDLIKNDIKDDRMAGDVFAAVTANLAEHAHTIKEKKFNAVMMTRGIPVTQPQPPQQDASDHKLYKVTAALCSNSGRADGLRKKAFTWLTSLKAKCRQDDETHGVSYTMIPRGTDGGDVQDEATSDPGGDDAQDAAASDQGGVSAVEYPPETMMLMFEVYFQDASKAQKAVDILNFEETSPFTFFLIDREKSSAKGESVTKHCDLIDIVGFEHYKKHEDSSSDTCSATTSESSRWNGKDSLKHHVFTYQTVSPKCPRGGINKAHLIDATYTNREKRLNVQGKKRLPRMDDDLADLPKIEVLKEAMEQCKIPREGDGPLTWKDLNFLDKSTDNFIGIESTLHPYVDNMACFDFELTKVLDEHKLSAKKESTYLCPQVEVAVTLYSTEDEVVAHLATSMKGFSHGMRGRSYLVHMYAHNPAIFAACMEIKSALNAKARSVDSGAT